MALPCPGSEAHPPGCTTRGAHGIDHARLGLRLVGHFVCVVKTKPRDFTQHALERFIARARMKPEKQDRATFIERRKGGLEEWLGRGWVLLVRRGTVVTVFKPKGDWQQSHYYGTLRRSDPVFEQADDLRLG